MEHKNGISDEAIEDLKQLKSFDPTSEDRLLQLASNVAKTFDELVQTIEDNKKKYGDT